MNCTRLEMSVCFLLDAYLFPYVSHMSYHFCSSLLSNERSRKLLQYCLSLELSVREYLKHTALPTSDTSQCEQLSRNSVRCALLFNSNVSEKVHFSLLYHWIHFISFLRSSIWSINWFSPTCHSSTSWILFIWCYLLGSEYRLLWCVLDVIGCWGRFGFVPISSFSRRRWLRSFRTDWYHQYAFVCE